MNHFDIGISVAMNDAHAADWVAVLHRDEVAGVGKAVELFTQHLSTLAGEFRAGGYIGDLFRTIKGDRRLPTLSYALVYNLEDQVSSAMLRSVPGFAILPQNTNDICENFIINLYARLLAQDTNLVKSFAPKETILRAAILELERVLSNLPGVQHHVQTAWYAKMEYLCVHLGGLTSDFTQTEQFARLRIRFQEWDRKAKAAAA